MRLRTATMAECQRAYDNMLPPDYWDDGEDEPEEVEEEPNPDEES
jgi:hypothetical protein